MKEQLVEMTQLSPRVIRVWFQNKRCKDKKRSILMKQMQQEKEKQMALQGITGVPMVASSPIRHDGAPMGVAMGGPLDVTAYQPPWKSLTEFALTHDLERLDPTTPQYQQLVQQGKDRVGYKPIRKRRVPTRWVQKGSVWKFKGGAVALPGALLGGSSQSGPSSVSIHCGSALSK
ncbi:Insulin enhancer protein ISL-2B [Chionoecetes opilio]|uniref:Insulin enhancer protein ISL-2B n=1 Tax=Chionoecetes opilio TaxID=41210 RepID=A0A8J5D3Z4_CHIOP|nr:Insulin enhancer protein ISL-2B [Chionoecetes opilio]